MESGLELYHNWRAQTSRVIERHAHADCVAKSVNLITKWMRDSLKNLTESKDIFIDSDSNDLDRKNDLATIVRSAVKLDAMLWKQKAWFEFIPGYPKRRFWDAIVCFDSKWMDSDFNDAEKDIDPSTGPKIAVNLIVAPGLEKTGTTEGKSYELVSYVCKAKVECCPEDLEKLQHWAR
jgi:hypothetical protein